MTGKLFPKAEKVAATPEEPAPAPTFMEAEEVKGAKKTVRKRKGRSANILAGRMMAKRQTGAELKDILGA